MQTEPKFLLHLASIHHLTHCSVMGSLTDGWLQVTLAKACHSEQLYKTNVDSKLGNKENSKPSNLLHHKDRLGKILQHNQVKVVTSFFHFCSENCKPFQKWAVRKAQAALKNANESHCYKYSVKTRESREGSTGKPQGNTKVTWSCRVIVAYTFVIHRKKRYNISKALSSHENRINVLSIHWKNR